LIERLNEGLRQNQGFGRKLTLISAPAGFGKTTLVSSWLHQLKDEGGTLRVKDEISSRHPSCYFIMDKGRPLR
jgi:LuxR family maltose regulon positive regulatory protein